MKTLVLYKSKTGFTKRYAEWIAQALSADLVPYEKRKQYVLDEYDTVLYGGGFHAGLIGGIGWFKKQLPSLSDKKVVVFATGASPAESEEVPKALAQNFTGDERDRIDVFYLQSGLCYEKMGAIDKLFMKVFRSMLKKAEGEQSEAYRMVQCSYDISSKDFIQPVVDCAKK